MVALHPEGVDRNCTRAENGNLYIEVALHPEGVDRNLDIVGTFDESDVALHPEGVDRNHVLNSLFVLVLCRPPPGGRG